MKRTILILACICSCFLLAPPTTADEAESAAETTAAAETGSPAKTAELRWAACPQPLEAQTDDGISDGPCSVQMECADSSVISCNGNSSCSTGGPGGLCVICDGVQGDCCNGSTCCQQCEIRRDNCTQWCGTELGPPCSVCAQMYGRCVGNCTGGCA